MTDRLIDDFERGLALIEQSRPERPCLLCGHTLVNGRCGDCETDNNEQEIEVE